MPLCSNTCRFPSQNPISSGAILALFLVVSVLAIGFRVTCCLFPCCWVRDLSTFTSVCSRECVHVFLLSKMATMLNNTRIFLSLFRYSNYSGTDFHSMAKKTGSYILAKFQMYPVMYEAFQKLGLQWKKKKKTTINSSSLFISFCIFKKCNNFFFLTLH